MSPFVTETRAVKAILAHIGVPTRPPVISPARAPPAWEEDPIQVDLGDDPLDPWLAATVTPLTLLARKSLSMDVAFGDDKMRICTDHAAHNMAILRHFVLNLIRLAPVKRKGGFKVQRLIAATSDIFRAELLGLL